MQFICARTLAVISCPVSARGGDYMRIIQALFDLFLSHTDPYLAQWHVCAAFCIPDLQVMPANKKHFPVN